MINTAMFCKIKDFFPKYFSLVSLILQINVGIVENMLQLALALVENFPSVSVYKAFLAYRALLKLFYAIHGKAEYYQDFIHSFGKCMKVLQQYVLFIYFF